MVRSTALEVAAACLVAGSAVMGCSGPAAGGGPATRQSPADRAMADPWNYGPKATSPDTTPPRGDSSSDRNGLKRELENVFNP